MNKVKFENFNKGLVTRLEEKSIPREASSNSLNWLTEGDKIELRRGSKIIGTEQLGYGKITGLFTAKKANGTEITFRKREQKLEYYDTSTEDWVEVGTNLFGSDAEDEDASFAQYETNHGSQLWICSPNSSLFKIMTANPGSYTDMYDSDKNFKGKITVFLNRIFLWQRKEDQTGVYGSYIDNLNNTTVSDEVIGTGDGSTKTFSDTLDFKAGGAKRTCFGITVTDGTEIFTDDYSGVLTGDQGGSGTINYTTGEISVTFAANVSNLQDVTCTYQWEDSTNEGVADFTKSATRLAGEGFVFRQDDAGGKVQTISTFNDIQYCFHQYRTWKLDIGADDTNATNRIYRELVGLPNWRASVATGDGIYYVDDTDNEDVRFRLLSFRGDSQEVVPQSISMNLELSNYLFDQAAAYEFLDYILIACRTADSDRNNRVFVYNRLYQSFDVLDYYVSCFAVSNGALWIGDSITDNVWEVFSGFDDNDNTYNNYWESNLDNLEVENLKKTKKIIVQGEIQKTQEIKVYLSLDNGDYYYIGSVSGNGSYVDIGSPITVGTNVVGTKTVGSGDVVEAYNYKREISVNTGKFQLAKIKFEAINIGYASVSMFEYKDIRIKSTRIPTKYR